MKFNDNDLVKLPHFFKLLAALFLLNYSPFFLLGLFIYNLIIFVFESLSLVAFNRLNIIWALFRLLVLLILLILLCIILIIHFAFNVVALTALILFFSLILSSSLILFFDLLLLTL